MYINSLGGEGILSFPNCEYLFADHLRDILVEMKDRKVYDKMLIYLESSFGGSIFEGELLPKNLSILAVTATDKNENSFASNCYPLDRVLGKNNKPVSLGVCLSDMFSSNLLKIAEQSDLKTLKIMDHIKQIKNLTHTSHVSYFGDDSILNMRLIDFFGNS